MKHIGSTWRGRSVGILLLGGLMLTGGCGQIQWKGGPVAAPPAEAECPFRPVKVRIHPFTALTYDEPTRTPVLEARLEPLDVMGDTAKGMGELRFEMYGAPEEASAGFEQRLAMWRVSMMDMAANARHWDPITRTYVFRLKLDPMPARQQKLTLDVQWTDPAGRRMTAETLLEMPAGHGNSPSEGGAGNAAGNQPTP